MKKAYMTPMTEVVNVNVQNALLLASGTGDIQKSDDGLTIESFGSSSSGSADSRRGGFWDSDD